MKTTIRHNNIEFSFTDDDIVEPDEFIPDGEYNPHDIHPWLLHDHGFTVCVVFASNLQDALDTAVDNGKMDRYLVSDEDMKDYDDPDELAYLGNASEPFDIDTLGYVELSNPKGSIVAQFNADPVAVRGLHIV